MRRCRVALPWANMLLPLRGGGIAQVEMTGGIRPRVVTLSRSVIQHVRRILRAMTIGATRGTHPKPPFSSFIPHPSSFPSPLHKPPPMCTLIPMHIVNNPLLSSPTSPPVSVAHGGGPYANTRRALESVDLSPVRGKRVLLETQCGPSSESRGRGLLRIRRWWRRRLTPFERPRPRSRWGRVRSWAWIFRRRLRWRASRTSPASETVR